MRHPLVTSIPSSMTAIEISQPGGPDVLKPATIPTPAPGAGEVLIKVAAAGVNRPDVLQRMGAYPPPPGASEIPGLEIAGEVVALGEGVSLWKAGDKVCALVAGGGYAEYCSVHETNALPVPDGLSMAEAAGIPETFFTVWTNVFERGALKPGESLLVHGGSSGIGTTAIQIASQLGSTVYTTAGSADKCAACEALGAERAINYREQDFVDVLKQATGKKGVDVILDMVGGDYIQRNIKAAARDGRIVNIAYLNGSKAEVDFMMVMLKRLTLTGSTLRIRPTADKAAIASALRTTVWPLIEAGKVKPQLFKTFPLAQADKAHTLMETSAHIGKIVLEV
ncbi:NAD(P)H-quinone oxidoreductase [Anderseniella sp. Alg231-50]|uniref:NAD(P)H-quinone oxidoreductase n=1 Tax=Anderseniella sp. Alg231-50 TaxID=1922226 RepID=UPI00307B15FC